MPRRANSRYPPSWRAARLQCSVAWAAGDSRPAGAAAGRMGASRYATARRSADHADITAFLALPTYRETERPPIGAPRCFLIAVRADGLLKDDPSAFGGSWDGY